MSSRRGPPLGNRNALKHGFYSRHFHKADIKDLEELEPRTLVQEISLLRLHVRRLTNYSLTVTDIAEYLDILRTINLLTSTINRLIKTQVFLAKEAPSFQEAVEQALDEVSEEWERNNPDLFDKETPAQRLARLIAFPPGSGASPYAEPESDSPDQFAPFDPMQGIEQS